MPDAEKRMMRNMIQQFLRFGVVGTVGFLVDSAVLLALMALGLGPYGGRVLSYLAAASTTFALNRAWTFRAAPRDAPMVAQWGRFLLLNLVGFAANYGTYAALIATVQAVAQHPVLGVAAGSLAGMFINFGLSRRFVFRAASR
ncbi:MAG: GtrA family protein [Roseococcus sp.]|nr:GtrA family protein [Roseococcus sp.]